MWPDHLGSETINKIFMIKNFMVYNRSTNKKKTVIKKSQTYEVTDETDIALGCWNK